MDYVVTTWLVQSSACSCPWSSLSHCPTGQPMTATGQSTKAARRTGRQEPRTGGAMQGPLVKYPSAVSCKCLSLLSLCIACFSDESVDSFVFPAWQPDTWTSFCMMADKGNRTFKGGDLLPQDAYYHYSDLHFQATLDGVPLYNTTSYKGGHKKGELVTLFGDEEWYWPARGSITDLHIWSRIITDKGALYYLHILFVLVFTRSFIRDARLFQLQNCCWRWPLQLGHCQVDITGFYRYSYQECKLFFSYSALIAM